MLILSIDAVDKICINILNGVQEPSAAVIAWFSRFFYAGKNNWWMTLEENLVSDMSNKLHWTNKPRYEAFNTWSNKSHL